MLNLRLIEEFVMSGSPVEFHARGFDTCAQFVERLLTLPSDSFELAEFVFLSGELLGQPADLLPSSSQLCDLFFEAFGQSIARHLFAFGVRESQRIEKRLKGLVL